MSSFRLHRGSIDKVKTKSRCDRGSEGMSGGRHIVGGEKVRTCEARLLQGVSERTLSTPRIRMEIVLERMRVNKEIKIINEWRVN